MRIDRLWITVVIGLFLAGGVAAAEAPKKIVFIAGTKSHGPGAHEYVKSLKLLEEAVKSVKPDLLGGERVRTEFYYDGWAPDERKLDNADVIVLFSDGSNHKGNVHPLLEGDRLEVLGKQMARGCGLVVLHYSTFVPKERGGEEMLEWVGGYFDYQSSTVDPRGHWSKHKTVEAKLRPAEGGHAITNGVNAIAMREELYWNMRFRENDARLRPVLMAEIPGESEEQTVAWAVERADGGRGFAYTGVHFHDNAKNEMIRRMLANGILWAAGYEVPAKGFDTKLRAWDEPRPRIADMEMGNFHSGTFTEGDSARGFETAPKSIAVKLGEGEARGKASIIFDTDTLRYNVGWTGAFVEYHPGRNAMLGIDRIDGAVNFSTKPVPGWSKDGERDDPRARPFGPLPRDWAKYQGLYVQGDRTTFAYRVGGARVLDSPWIERHDGVSAFTRTIEISKPGNSMSFVAAEHLGNPFKEKQVGGVRMAVSMDGEKALAVALNAMGVRAGFDLSERDQLWVSVAGSGDSEIGRVKTFTFHGDADALEGFAKLVKRAGPSESVVELTKAGKGRWGDAIETAGVRGSDRKAYVVDTITAPLENRFKSIMHFGGFDFFSNGDAAISTMEGDVWIVSGIDEDLDKLKWKRHATGLYHPLGLKIVDDKVYTAGRDQITRLHDLNNDGEADFYENFNNDIQTSKGGHEYVTGLDTDQYGNFFFMKCNAGTEHGGSLLKVSADGKKLERVATGFRNPNGMSVNPKTGVVTEADQQGTWVPASRIDLIKPGGFYGYMPAHHRETEPTTYDGPLCWIPHPVDNSCGGQAWVTSKRWGPYADGLLHLSYGRCKLFAVLQENVGGVDQGGVVEFPLSFLSGVMRADFSDHDGQLYVCGLQGWQTSGLQDGCFQRVRYTGKAVTLPTGLSVHANGVKVSFDVALDKEYAEDVDSWAVEQWGYRWTKNYGSPEYSVLNPEMEGHDAVEVKSVRLSADGKSAFLDLGKVGPVMQMRVQYNLDSEDGELIKGSIYNTIHKVGPRLGP